MHILELNCFGWLENSYQIVMNYDTAKCHVIHGTNPNNCIVSFIKKKKSELLKMTILKTKSTIYNSFQLFVIFN